MVYRVVWQIREETMNTHLTNFPRLLTNHNHLKGPLTLPRIQLIKDNWYRFSCFFSWIDNEGNILLLRWSLKRITDIIECPFVTKFVELVPRVHWWLKENWLMSNRDRFNYFQSLEISEYEIDIPTIFETSCYLSISYNNQAIVEHK